VPRRGDVIAERFELEAEVGAGGMGSVFRARDRESGERVAIKFLHADHADHDGSVSRFERECETLQRLEHPGIVRYLAHGDRPAPFLAMAWIEGETLAHRIEETGLSLAESIAVARRLAEALAVAHAAGVVHRDLKPTNVILREGLDVTLIDFGVSRVADSVPLTRTGITVGTPGYMSPEQVRGARTLDGRSDVFVLGAVLHECITGQPAFCGTNPMAMQVKICLADAPLLTRWCAEAPAGLVELVERMLAKQATARPTAAEVAQRLAQLEGAGIPVTWRRPARAAREVATRVDPPRTPGLRCLVLGEPGGRALSTEELAEVHIQFAPLAETFHVMREGKLVAELAGDELDTVQRAARFALRLAKVLPDYIVVITMAAGAEIDAAIDRGSRLAATLSLKHIFAGAGARPGGVYVDPEIRKRLDASFRITPTPDGVVIDEIG
jgi:eukaryotic-like serine/threonine-protein kinase